MLKLLFISSKDMDEKRDIQMKSENGVITASNANYLIRIVFSSLLSEYQLSVEKMRVGDIILILMIEYIIVVIKKL